MNHSTVVIIGGGICGLMAATVLQRQDLTVTILDKGKGLGGRMASRRIRYEDQVGTFDFGTQYFKVRDSRFRSWVNDWIQSGVACLWSEGMPSVEGQEKSTGISLYRGVPSNRSIAQHLAKSLVAETQTRVTFLQWENDQWQIHCDSGQVYSADYLVMTPPVPQTLTLLDTSALQLPESLRQTLEGIQYAPCLTLMVLLDKEANIPAPGGLWLRGEPLVWIACNTQKGTSPGGHAVTIQAGPQFSHSHLDDDDATVITSMLMAAEPWLNSRVLSVRLHRWRYSHPLTYFQDNFLACNCPGPIYLGGDAFGRGKVEGAVLSGLAIAEHLLTRLEEAKNSTDVP